MLRMLAQACGDPGAPRIIRHRFMSAYEEACEWAVVQGLALDSDDGCVLHVDPFEEDAPALPATWAIKDGLHSAADAAAEQQARAISPEFQAGAAAMKAAIKATMRPYTWHAGGLEQVEVHPPDPCTCAEQSPQDCLIHRESA